MTTKKTPVISLDIWDTILRRTCHPDEIKLYTAQRMQLLLGTFLNIAEDAMLLLERRRNIEYQIGQNCKKNGFDDEYEIEEVLDQVINEIAKETLPVSKRHQIRDDLVESEIQQEIRVTYLDDDLVRLLQSVKHRQLIIISDFYMSWDKLSRILEANSFPFPIDHHFISCDINFNKRSGRLFSHVSSMLQVKPSSILHIGDNEYSDIVMAQKHGINTHFFSRTPECINKINNERLFKSRFHKNNKTDDLLLEKFSSNLSITHKSKQQSRLFDQGRRMSVFFVGFALYIQELCALQEHQQVHFFTREGKFFKNIFDEVIQQNPYDLPPIKSYLLPVSRLATFFPSLRDFSINEMMRIWSQYSTQSMDALFHSFNIPPDEFSAFFTKHTISSAAPIEYPWKDERIIALFHDKEFLNRLQRIHSKRIQLLTTLFDSLHFGKDNKALIVDIGWRGSIQDNIAHIYPDTQISGIYLGLQKFLNDQPGNTSKHGYITDHNKETTMHTLLRHVRPFEMLCNVTGGSACGYALNNNSEVKPIYQCDSDEDHVHTEWISHIQDGILANITHTCKMIQQHGISVSELRALGAEIAREFIDHPSKDICEAYFTLNHNETFGVGQFVHPQNTFRLQDKLLGYIFRSRKKKFITSLEQSGWPQALLKTHYGGLLYKFNNIKNKFSNL